jgi:hypothetical protein
LAASYIAFLAHLPEGFSEVRDISLEDDAIVVHGGESDQEVRASASGLKASGLI